MIIQNKRNLTIHNSIDEAKKFMQNNAMNNADTLKEGEVFYTRYKSDSGECNLIGTSYKTPRGIPYFVFNEVTKPVPSLSMDFKKDIIEVYVGFDSGTNIKNLVLGRGLKDPYNFVIEYNCSYDPITIFQFQN